MFPFASIGGRKGARSQGRRTQASGGGEVKRGDKNRVGEESGEEAKKFLGLKQLV